MNGGIALSRWSEALVEEIFEDREGYGKPVSTIEAGGPMLARALARSGVHTTERAALENFIGAFPARWRMVRWFGGGEDPGEAIPAFLILCCVAASEAIGSEANDYRERLRQMMGWDAIIMDCGALPALWRRLERLLAKEGGTRRLRRLILPDPRFRTQIGHAIELTFPSRQDARGLKQDLDASGVFDTASPTSVLRWLAARRDRYSPTFQETFADFQVAWRSGSRVLTDHRFWSGWRMVVESRRPPVLRDAFHIVSDEWGRYELVTPEGMSATLQAIEASAPSGIRSLMANGSPLLLREVDWGRWAWAGNSGASAREARAALIRQKSFNPAIIKQLAPVALQGAEGWAMTMAVDLLPGARDRLAIDDDELVDARFGGVPRIDGGWLARPSFALRLSTTGPVEHVEIEGEVANLVKLRRAGPQEWLMIPSQPLSDAVSVTVEARGAVLRRAVSLRAAALAPAWKRDVPDRYIIEEINASPWTPLTDTGGTIGRSFVIAAADPPMTPKQAVFDLVEYLAARPGVMPLGGFLELLGALPDVDEVGRWALLRGLMECGLVDPLRVRGWRGRAVIARPPRAVLARAREGCRALIDGLVNEVLAGRIAAIARDSGLTLSHVAGLGPWAPHVLCLHGPERELLAMAGRADLPIEALPPGVSAQALPSEPEPDADGSTHGIRSSIAGFDALRDRDVEVLLCRREADDAPPVWMVGVGDREPRFWSQRHLALLDACRQANVAPFRVVANRLEPTMSGVFLPLPLARWMRLVTGVSSGQSGGHHVYALGKELEPMIRAILRLPSVEFPPRHEAGRVVRRHGEARALARQRGEEVEVTPVWRWARDQRGGQG